MKKPRYVEDLLKIIFFFLGIAFVGMGFLSFTGLIKPSANSQVQDPTLLGIYFSFVGLGFLAVQIILGISSSHKRKLHTKLIADDTKISGIVEAVSQQTLIQYNRQSPYRVSYVYTYQGSTYHHKSCLLWEKPVFSPGDPITVFVNDSGKSTLLF